MDFAAEQWVLVSMLLALIIAFVTLETKKGGKTVTFHEVSRLLNSDSAILLDVRDAADYKAGHITGAINIPYGSVATRLSELEKYKTQQIILADKMGQHAGHARLQRRQRTHARRAPAGRTRALIRRSRRRPRRRRR